MIPASELDIHDIIESHDDWDHEIRAIRYNEYAQTVEVDVWVMDGTGRRYTTTFNFYDKVRITSA